MTTASPGAACNTGDPSVPVPEQEGVVGERRQQRPQLRPVDLTRYRRQRPAGPVPCFTGPQAPAEVLLFRSKTPQQGGTQ
jgi:hypothetical protein